MTQQVEALLTEHLRYTPLSLIDDIINTVNTIVYRAIEAIENGLFSMPLQQLGYSPDSDTSRDTSTLTDPEHPDATAEIENGVHQLETLLEATVDKTFDKFEIYALRNILTVDDKLVPWMRLGHYEGLTLPLHATTPTPDSLLALRRKLKETRKLNLALRTAHARNAATIAQLRGILSPPNDSNITTTDPPSPHQPDKSLAFLTSHPSAPQLGIAPFTTTNTTSPPNTNPSSSSSTNTNKTNPLTQQTTFFLSQLPALRAALETLRPRLSTLPAKIGEVDWESRREERRGFIEGRVRRVVGDTVGEGGEGGLGEGVGVGVGVGRVGREEVVGLEGVVRGMGGGENRMEVDG